ncbi:alpha/beta hydrolase domain-containing protein [Longibacter salinarum]|nr:alpha/beta hydrolase domain-containing protein [Longibacter salinarum]
MARRSIGFLVLFLVFIVAGTRPAEARVVRVEVEERTVVNDGESTGPHGRYEVLRGKIYFAFDPAHPRNQAITDLDLAPRNAKGEVEAWTRFVLMQPTVVEMRRGIGLVEVVNRGRPAALRYFNDASAPFDSLATDPDALGDLLLLRQGLTMMWLGWQWDVPHEEGRFRLHVPRASEPDGSLLTGLVRSDWVVEDTAFTLPLSHRDHVAYPPIRFDHPDHLLTVRTGRNAPREVVPRSDWSFGVAEVDSVGTSLQPDSTHIASEKGFRPGRIYELVYRSSKPAVVGLGLAAIRDAVAYLKYDTRSVAPVDRVFGLGISQTGRFLRQFIYDGFNTTEDGRMAFDGMMVLTAGAGRGSFNHRFAQPSRDGHRYSAFAYPTDIFPFSTATQFDSLATQSNGLAAHLESASHMPRTMFINSGYEYYGRAASLIHTTPDGTADVAPLPSERIYHIASAQHVPGSLPEAAAPDSVTFVEAHPVDTRTVYRALLVAMTNWLDHGTPPPPSQYPTVLNDDLVPIENLSFPSIEGVDTPTDVHTAHRMDYGPKWERNRVITQQPPRMGTAFGTRIPQVDSIGNEQGGIRSVFVQAPLATITPWRLRTAAANNTGELADFFGGMIPLPRTPVERERASDPRPAISTLYPARDAYRARVREAADRLIEGGFLLTEDREDEMERAMALWDWIMAP